MSVCLVTTLRADVDDTLRFVAHHRHVGVTHQFLFFDAHDDPAIPLLADAPDVTATACTPEHWGRLGLGADAMLTHRQKANANSALELARLRGFEWIAHIDSDEFIELGGDLPLDQRLASLSPDAPSVLMWSLEAVPGQDSLRNPLTEITLFRNAERAQAIERTAGSGGLFEGRFLRGHLGKAVSRVAMTSSLSIHFAHSEDGSRLVPLRQPLIRLRHYDCPTFDAWLRKWRARVSGAVRVGVSPNRALQMHAFRAADRQQSEAALRDLYARLYLLDDETKALLIRSGAIVRLGGLAIDVRRPADLR